MYDIVNKEKSILKSLFWFILILFEVKYLVKASKRRIEVVQTETK